MKTFPDDVSTTVGGIWLADNSEEVKLARTSITLVLPLTVGMLALGTAATPYVFVLTENAVSVYATTGVIASCCHPDHDVPSYTFTAISPPVPIAVTNFLDDLTSTWKTPYLIFVLGTVPVYELPEPLKKVLLVTDKADVRISFVVLEPLSTFSICSERVFISLCVAVLTHPVVHEDVFPYLTHLALSL